MQFTFVRFNKNCPKPSGWFSGVALNDAGEEFFVVSAKTAGYAPGSLVPGCMFEADIASTGYWKGHPQIEVANIRVLRAHMTLKTLAKLLSTLSDFKGVGPKRAEKILAIGNGDVMVAARMNPEDLAKQAGIPLQVAKGFCQVMGRAPDVVVVSQAFPSLPVSAVKKVAKALSDEHMDWEFAKNFGGSSVPFAERVRRLSCNPYALCDLSGVSWESADKAATIDCGIDYMSPVRIECAVKHTVRNVLEHGVFNMPQIAELPFNDIRVSEIAGSMYLSMKDADQVNAVLTAVSRLLFPERNLFMVKETLEDICKALTVKQSSAFVEEPEGFYRRELWEAQNAIVDRISYIEDRMNDTASWQLGETAVRRFLWAYRSDHGFALNDAQRKAALGCLMNDVSVLVGGPGRGKTFTVAAVIDAYRNLHPGRTEIYCLAPTGKAVSNLARNMAHLRSNWVRQDDVELHLQTVAKFIHTVKYINIMSKFNVHRDVKTLAPPDLVIVDETSMLGVEDAGTLLDMCPEAQFIFVGDDNQLPSISPGEFLSELVASDSVPTFSLNEDMRTVVGSTIPVHADAIAAGDAKVAWMSDSSFDVTFLDDDWTAMQQIEAEYFRLVNSGEELSSIGCLSLRKRDVEIINMYVSDQLNPINRFVPQLKQDTVRYLSYYDTPGYPINYTRSGTKLADAKNRLLRIGDRVLCTKNCYDLQKSVHVGDDYEQAKKEIFSHAVNGDVGVICRYYQTASMGNSNDLGIVVVHMDDGTFVEFDMETARDVLVLGWAMTVHKAQGSEYDNVLFFVPKNPPAFMSSRNLYYTAVTRAKSRCCVMGSFEAMTQGIKEERAHRLSTLATRLAVL